MKPRIFALFLLFVLVVGCSGSDAPSNTPAGNTFIQQTGDFVLREDLQVLPADGSVVVQTITDEQVVLTGTVPTITPGSALMMNSGQQQFIRRVVSVSEQPDGSVVVVTTPGSLLDVFVSADIEQTEILGAEALQGIQPVMEGVTIGEPVANRVEGGFSLPIHFENSPLTDRNGNVLARANGDISVTFGFETALQFNASKFLNPPTTIEHLKLAPFVQARGNLQVEGLAAGDFEQEYVVASFPGGIPLAGFGPVSITANLDLLAYANGSINVSGTTGFNADIFATFGIQAFDGNFGVFNPAPEATFNVTPPDVQGTAQFSLSLARPKVSISVLGLGDAHVKADVVRAGVQASFTNTPQPGYSIGAVGEFEVLAGATIKIGPFGIPPFQIPDRTIFNQTLPVATFRYAVGDPIFLPRAGAGSNPFVTTFLIPTAPQLRPGEYGFVLAQGLKFLGPLPLVIPQDVNWSSSNGNVIEVLSSSGIFTLVRARQAGTARITSTATGSPAGAVDLTVLNTPLSSLRIEPPGADITNRASMQARAIGTYADGTQVDVTDFVQWASSNSGLAIVTPRGEVQARSDATSNRGGLLQSAATGQITLSASFRGQRASADIGINTPRITQLFLLRGPAPNFSLTLPGEIFPGDGVQMEAVAFFADGTRRVITSEVQWSSDDEFVAEVTPAGLINAISSGNTRIRARLNDLERQFFLRVDEGIVDSLQVTPSEVTLAPGQRVPLNVFANFAGGGRSDVTALARVRAIVGEVAGYDATSHELIARNTGISLFYITYGGSGALMAVLVLPNQASHLFVANTLVPGIAVTTVGADGGLTAVTGSPFALALRPFELLRLGDFVVASLSSNAPNQLSVNRYDPDSGALSPAGSVPLTGNFFQPLPMDQLDANTMVVVEGFQNLIRLLVMDLATGALVEHDNEVVVGTGPVDVAVSPGSGANPTLVFVANQDSNDVTVYLADLNTGQLTLVPGSPFPNPVAGDQIGAVEVVQDNLYVTNRVSNTISRYTINLTTGVLTPGTSFASGGVLPGRMTRLETPAALFLYCANSGSSNVTGFQVNPTNGALAPLAGFPVAAGGNNPHQFTQVSLPDGTVVLYLTTSNQVSGFEVDTTSGALTPLTGSPFGGFSSPDGIAD